MDNIFSTLISLYHWPIDNNKPHYIPRLELTTMSYRHMRQLVDTQVRKYGLCIIKVLQFHVLTVSLAVKLPTYVASLSSYVSFFTMPSS